MDFGALALEAHDLPMPAAAAQFKALAAGIGGVLLVTLLMAAWAARRIAPGTAAEPDAPGAGPRSLAAVPALRLLAAVVLAVFLLPAAAAIRQLWPYPDLGWTMIAGWIGFMLPTVAAWLALARCEVRAPDQDASTERRRGP